MERKSVMPTKAGIQTPNARKELRNLDFGTCQSDERGGRIVAITHRRALILQFLLGSSRFCVGDFGPF